MNIKVPQHVKNESLREKETYGFVFISSNVKVIISDYLLSNLLLLCFIFCIVKGAIIFDQFLSFLPRL